MSLKLQSYGRLRGLAVLNEHTFGLTSSRVRTTSSVVEVKLKGIVKRLWTRFTIPFIIFDLPVKSLVMFTVLPESLYDSLHRGLNSIQFYDFASQHCVCIDLAN